MALERQWFINLAFLLNYQNVRWIDATHSFSVTSLTDTQSEDASINQLIPWYEDTITELTQYSPHVYVTSTSTKPDDKDAALLGTKICRGLVSKLNLIMLMFDKTMWQLTCGTGIYRFFWNGRKGNLIGEVEGVKTYEGFVDGESINPFEFYPVGNPAGTDMLRVSIQARYTDVSLVEEMYPQFKGLIRAEVDMTSASQYKQKMDILQGVSVAPSQTAKGVLFCRSWEAQSGKYPNGLYCVWAGDILLERRELPDIKLDEGADKKLFTNGGFVFYPCHKIPGRFWAQSKIEQVLKNNRKLNKLLNDMLYDVAATSHPKPMAPKGAIPKGKWNNDSQDLIEIDTTLPNPFTPQYLSPPGISATAMELFNLIYRNNQDLLAVHDQSQGQSSSDAKSGRGIIALQGADKKKRGSLFVFESENKKSIFTAYLKLIQEHVRNKQLLTYVKPGNNTEAVSFSGADLRNQTGVEVEDNNVIPEDRAGRQEFAELMYKEGLLGTIGDDETRRRAILIMQGGSLEDVFETANVDTIEARAENKMLKQGKPAEVQMYHSHMPHLQEHLIPLKKGEYDDLPPICKELAVAHVQDHIQMMSEGQKAQTEEQGKRQMMPAGKVK